MLKVSFKGNFKRVKRLCDNIIQVSLSGTMHIPEDLIIADSVYSYIGWKKRFGPCLRVYYDDRSKEVLIEVKGEAKRHPDDEDNVVIGERIAEARAKIKLYKFMYHLCEALANHYNRILNGFDIPLRKTYSSDSILEKRSFYQSLWIKESQHLGKLLEES